MFKEQVVWNASGNLRDPNSRVQVVEQPKASFSWFALKAVERNNNLDFLAGDKLVMCHFEDEVTVSQKRPTQFCYSILTIAFC